MIIMHWIYIALCPRHSKTHYIDRGDLTHHHQCVAPIKGDARQPICARTLTTHQLEVEGEGINESANYTIIQGDD